MTVNNKQVRSSVVKPSVLNCHTVRIGPMSNIPATLRSLGYEAAPVLAMGGFKPEQFENPDTRVSYAAMGKLLACCKAVTGCEHFGLLVGKCAGPSHLGIAGYQTRNAEDVEAALRGLIKYLNLHDQGGVPTLTTTTNYTLLGYAIQLPGVEGADQIYDLAIAVACNIMRALCGKNWNPTEVILIRQPPQEETTYKNFFKATLRFNKNESAIVFPTRWLRYKLPTADPILHQHLTNEADALLTKQNDNLTENLRYMLRQSLMSKQCKAADFAGLLGLHERTLHRRLKTEGTSFRQELGKVRLTVSQQLLSETAMSLAEIASALSYEDASAFNRAFKQWTGITPGRWRSTSGR